MEDYNNIVLFDGVCNFCNSSVNFIIERDPSAKFKFTPLQSEIGEELIKKYSLPNTLETIILLQHGKIYTKSSAALRIAKSLNGLWSLMFFFYLVPKFLRDPFYMIVANNRYKWFGKQETCMVPTAEVRNRYLMS